MSKQVSENDLTKNKDGSVVEYYRPAHNKRHSETGKPAANIMHSFGRADEPDRDYFVRLCRSIVRVCGLKVTDPIAEDSGTTDLPGFTKDLKLTGTQTPETSLSRTITCPAKDIRMTAGEKISETLDEVTLGNLAAGYREKRQTGVQAKV